MATSSVISPHVASLAEQPPSSSPPDSRLRSALHKVDEAAQKAFARDPELTPDAGYLTLREVLEHSISLFGHGLSIEIIANGVSTCLRVGEKLGRGEHLYEALEKALCEQAFFATLAKKGLAPYLLVSEVAWALEGLVGDGHPRTKAVLHFVSLPARGADKVIHSVHHAAKVVLEVTIPVAEKAAIAATFNPMMLALLHKEASSRLSLEAIIEEEDNPPLPVPSETTGTSSEITVSRVDPYAPAMMMESPFRDGLPPLPPNASPIYMHVKAALSSQPGFIFGIRLDMPLSVSSALGAWTVTLSWGAGAIALVASAIVNFINKQSLHAVKSFSTHINSLSDTAAAAMNDYRKDSAALRAHAQNDPGSSDLHAQAQWLHQADELVGRTESSYGRLLHTLGIVMHATDHDARQAFRQNYGHNSSVNADLHTINDKTKALRASLCEEPPDALDLRGVLTERARHIETLIRMYPHQECVATLATTIDSSAATLSAAFNQLLANFLAGKPLSLLQESLSVIKAENRVIESSCDNLAIECLFLTGSTKGSPSSDPGSAFPEDPALPSEAREYLLTKWALALYQAPDSSDPSSVEKAAAYTQLVGEERQQYVQFLLQSPNETLQLIRNLLGYAQVCTLPGVSAVISSAISSLSQLYAQQIMGIDAGVPIGSYNDSLAAIFQEGLPLDPKIASKLFLKYALDLATGNNAEPLRAIADIERAYNQLPPEEQGQMAEDKQNSIALLQLSHSIEISKAIGSSFTTLSAAFNQLIADFLAGKPLSLLQESLSVIKAENRVIGSSRDDLKVECLTTPTRESPSADLESVFPEDPALPLEARKYLFTKWALAMYQAPDSSDPSAIEKAAAYTQLIGEQRQQYAQFLLQSPDKTLQLIRNLLGYAQLCTLPGVSAVISSAISSLSQLYAQQIMGIDAGVPIGSYNDSLAAIFQEGLPLDPKITSELILKYAFGIAIGDNTKPLRAIADIERAYGQLPPEEQRRIAQDKQNSIALLQTSHATRITTAYEAYRETDVFRGGRGALQITQLALSSVPTPSHPWLQVPLKGARFAVSFVLEPQVLRWLDPHILSRCSQRFSFPYAQELTHELGQKSLRDLARGWEVVSLSLWGVTAIVCPLARTVISRRNHPEIRKAFSLLEQGGQFLRTGSQVYFASRALGNSQKSRRSTALTEPLGWLSLFSALSSASRWAPNDPDFASFRPLRDALTAPLFSNVLAASHITNECHDLVLGSLSFEAQAKAKRAGSGLLALALATAFVISYDRSAKGLLLKDFSRRVREGDFANASRGLQKSRSQPEGVIAWLQQQTGSLSPQEVAIGERFAAGMQQLQNWRSMNGNPDNLISTTLSLLRELRQKKCWLSPLAIDLHFGLVDLYIQAGRESDAIKELEAIGEQDPRSHLKLAQLLQTKQPLDLEQVTKHVKKAREAYVQLYEQGIDANQEGSLLQLIESLETDLDKYRKAAIDSVGKQLSQKKFEEARKLICGTAERLSQEERALLNTLLDHAEQITPASPRIDKTKELIDKLTKSDLPDLALFLVSLYIQLGLHIEAEKLANPLKNDYPQTYISLAKIAETRTPPNLDAVLPLLFEGRGICQARLQTITAGGASQARRDALAATVEQFSFLLSMQCQKLLFSPLAQEIMKGRCQEARTLLQSRGSSLPTDEQALLEQLITHTERCKTDVKQTVTSKELIEKLKAKDFLELCFSLIAFYMESNKPTEAVALANSMTAEHPQAYFILGNIHLYSSPPNLASALSLLKEGKKKCEELLCTTTGPKAAALTDLIPQFTTAISDLSKQSWEVDLLQKIEAKDFVAAHLWLSQPVVPTTLRATYSQYINCMQCLREDEAPDDKEAVMTSARKLIKDLSGHTPLCSALAIKVVLFCLHIRDIPSAKEWMVHLAGIPMEKLLLAEIALTEKNTQLASTLLLEFKKQTGATTQQRPPEIAQYILSLQTRIEAGGNSR